uniref:peptidylprolyl isomerase n=1 Tax=Oryzias sinensis TaxID=183150 RepID=A0A8C8DI70_9TELE
MFCLCFRGKLASLFEPDQEAGGQGNGLFQYTAPKQPKKGSTPATANQNPAVPVPGTPAVLVASAVQAFKYINGQYMKQGKLGAAVLGNHTTKEYKLLLYLSQKKQLTAARIHMGFIFTVQPNNYCTFYDDQRQNWSLMFESEKASSDFCKEVCLSKASSVPCLDSVVIQDLCPGEGKAVETGDSLEVVYTGWLLQNQTIGQMFDTNQNKDKLLRLRIGAGKVIKLFSPDYKLFLYIYNHRELPPRPKANSLSEQLAVSTCTNPDATKAKLISRMAKMGQPLLPFLPEAANQPESSDSELEASFQLILYWIGWHRSPSTFNAFGRALMSVLYSCTQTSVTSSQMPPVNHVYPTQTPAYVAPGDMTSFLMIEARQQNTEVRLAVGKVADKVEQLASKVQKLFHRSNFSNASMTMETAMIVNSIQRVVQENERLKKEVFEKNCRIEEQNNKISDLINQNQRCLEQSHQLMEQRNDSLRSSSQYNQTQLLQAEQDKGRLTEELASSMAKVSQMQLEASAHQQKAAELKSKLNSALQEGENSRQLLVAQETQLEELKEVAEKTKTQYRLEKQKCKEMELKVNNMEKELVELKSAKGTVEQALSEKEKKLEAERQRWEQEVEAIRRSSQKELDNLRAQLHEARDSNDNNQQLQELEDKWKRKYEQMLASAKALHQKELAELRDEKDALGDELDTTTMETRCHLNCFIRLVVFLQVKRVMNGVFQSLRAEFDLHESYSGQVVLGIIVTTIKVKTDHNMIRRHYEHFRNKSNPSKSNEELEQHSTADSFRMTPDETEPVDPHEAPEEAPEEAPAGGPQADGQENNSLVGVEAEAENGGETSASLKTLEPPVNPPPPPAALQNSSTDHTG